MENERLKKQLAFALEVDKEKNILRQTHLSGHGRRENDAEHAWHMAVMIYLLKEYANEEIALKYSGIRKYPETAFAALEEMLLQQGRCVIEDGLIKKGVIVRHLCLPSLSRDSLSLIERLSCYLGKYDFMLSLMSQYTPDFLLGDAERFGEINRRITGLEYGRVSRRAVELGFEGFFQERCSASKSFTPKFDADGFGKSERIDIDEF